MHRSRLLRNLQLGIENVMLHKLRSILTMLGMVFGVASVIAMLSVGEGASRQALDQIQRLGSHNIILTAKKPAADDAAVKGGRSSMLVYGLTYNDHRRITETLDTVRVAVPAKILLREARVGKQRADIRIVGTTPTWFSLVQRDILAGRMLVDEDISARRAVAVITESTARRLLSTKHALGHTIRFGDNLYEVVGIVRNEGGEGTTLQTPDRAMDVYIPLSVARARYGDLDVRASSGSFTREQVELHQIIVNVDALENVEATAGAIERMLSTSHKNKDYEAHVPLALLRQAQETQRTFNIVLGSIACISLLVGGIGIMNIMLAAVTERTREIGIRRAIGARRRQIIHQFLIETVVLSSSGGIIGVVLGLLVPMLIASVANMPTVITTWSVLLSLCISVAIGIIFGIYPAVRAANLDPIEALRHE